MIDCRLPLGRIIEVTSENYLELVRVADSLKKDRAKLLRNMSRYPLEIEFVNYRFVVISSEELDSLIQTVDQKLEAWYLKSPTRFERVLDRCRCEDYTPLHDCSRERNTHPIPHSLDKGRWYTRLRQVAMEALLRLRLRKLQPRC